MRSVRCARRRRVQPQVLQQRCVERIGSGVKILGAHVDDERRAVEIDGDASDIAADCLGRFDQHDLALAIEQPGQRDASHSGADNADPAASVRRAGEQRATRHGREAAQHIAPCPGSGHSSRGTARIMSRTRQTLSTTKRPGYADQARSVNAPVDVIGARETPPISAWRTRRSCHRRGTRRSSRAASWARPCRAIPPACWGRTGRQFSAAP